MNCIFGYIDSKWDPFDFALEPDNETSDNLSMTARVTKPFKFFMFAITFFILLFVRQFRQKMCRD